MDNTQMRNIGIAAIAVVLILMFGGSACSNYNYGNSAEQGLKASYQHSENTLTQYTEKVQEAAQVPVMATQQWKDVMTAALGARYGQDGSKGVFQMIREQNPSLDAGMYRKIQQIIEAGRDDFRDSQDRFIDVKRQYVTSLGAFPSGMWLHMFGYPKIDLAKYQPVTSTSTDVIFESHHDQTIKLGR